jgi:hypothetical protein
MRVISIVNANQFNQLRENHEVKFFNAHDYHNNLHPNHAGNVSYYTNKNRDIRENRQIAGFFICNSS